MVNVLMVTTRFIYGGIEKLLLDIFENTRNHCIHYDLLTLTSERDERLIKRITDFGVGYYSLDINEYGKVTKKYYHYKKLYLFLKNHQYDVIHYNITSYRRSIDLAVAKFAGVKVRIIHSHSANIINPFYREMYKPLKKLYDYVATDYFACSDEAANYLFSKAIIKNRRYVVISNGISIHDFAFSEENRKKIRKELGVSENIKLIGHVGRFTEAKNHKFLIQVYNEVVKKNPNYMLALVGEGERREDIIRSIKAYGLENKVLLIGVRSDIGSVLSAFDSFLFPSVWEGLGISVVEAQCNGLRCFVSEKVPEKALLTSNVTRIELSRDPAFWAEKILEDECVRVDEMYKIEAAGFSIDHSVKQLEKIYMKDSISISVVRED